MPRTKTTKRASSSNSPDQATLYAQAVVDGDVIAGPLVRLASERHLRDLKDGPKRGLVWRTDLADRVYRYFEHVLCLNGGDFEGKPFLLEPWQKFIAGSIFGWLRANGCRRFRTAYLEIGKGNGKSPLAAGVGLYCLTSDDEDRAEVYAAASKKDQAMILFRDAVAMRDLSPHLKARLIKYGGLNPWNLFFQGKNSFFRAISNDDSQSGPRPHCALLDELHEHPDANCVNMMRKGVKGRRQPLMFEITNSGVDRNSICYQHHEYSERILKGVIDNDAWFAFVCGLDEGDDWKDESVWPKANPNLGVSIGLEYLRDQVREAAGMPALQSLVRRLNFCEWVDAAAPWIDGDKWRACENADIDLGAYLGSRCWAALDLSASDALTALTLVFPRPDGSGLDAFTFFWAPAEGIREREERDRVPYTVWRDQGFLEVTPGATVDYAWVARRIADLRESYGIEALAFDRWRIKSLTKEFDDIELEYTILNMDAKPEDLENATGLLMLNHGQGFQDMTPAVEAVTSAVLNKTLRVKRNPVMTMCSANAVITTDPAGSKKFDKRASVGRIDGVITLAMGLRCAGASPRAGKSFWE